MYKFLILDTNRKQNNFLVFLKQRPNSHSFNKLVIKSKNTCKYIYFLNFYMELRYDFFYIFERLDRMQIKIKIVFLKERFFDFF